jgi:hypothetical protein
MHGQPKRQCAALHGTYSQCLATAGRTVGLGEYGANTVPFGEPLQRRNGEVRRAGEAQLQRGRSSAQGSQGRRGSAKIAVGGPLSALLFQAAANQLALKLREVINEDFALKMIDLVLDAHSQ